MNKGNDMQEISRSRKVVVTFPGGRGDEIPLLYFGAKIFEDQGYEKIFVNHPASGERSFEAIYENAEEVLISMDLHLADEVVFIGKSLGTVVACKLKEKFGASASLILFTPLQETLPFIRNSNHILLVAAGAKDRYLDTAVLQEACAKENIPCYIEPGVGHRKEVMKDLPRNLEILRNVIGRLEKERV